MTSTTSYVTVTDQFCGAGGSSLGAVNAGAEKACRVCGATKPFTEFYSRPEAKDGLRGECKACTKVRSRASVERNPERRAAYMDAYRVEHREELARKASERIARTSRLHYYRAYRASNLDRLHKNEQSYRRRHPEKLVARRHQRRALGLDQEAREYIVLLLRDPCVYCGGAGGTIDHIVPVAAGGTNHWTNLASACMSCNSKKHDLPLIVALFRKSQEGRP